MHDFEMQRINMVESQVRPSDVTDRRIIAAMLDIAREDFVPEKQRALAYMDGDIPLGSASSARRQMMAPRTLARLIQAAEIDAGSRVLHLAAGTGYATAVLARLAGKVVAVEPDAGLAETATRLIAAKGIANARVVVAPLAAGSPDDAPYDAILVEGAIARLPDMLADQLKDGGRLVAIDATTLPGRATVWQRTGSTTNRRSLFDAAGAILPEFDVSREFTL